MIGMSKIESPHSITQKRPSSQVMNHNIRHCPDRIIYYWRNAIIAKFLDRCNQNHYLASYVNIRGLLIWDNHYAIILINSTQLFFQIHPGHWHQKIRACSTERDVSWIMMSEAIRERERERERDDRNERAWETQKILFPRTFKHSYKIIRWYYTGYKWWERTCVENTSSFATVKRTEHVGWDRVHSRALSNEISIRFFLFSHDNEVEVKYFTERPYICNEYDERTFDMWSDSLKS